RWEQVDGVAVTRGPGLVGCLLVGVNLGQAFAWARKLPVIGVSHLAAHVFAGLLEEPDLHPPVLGLVVSGGHSDLIRWEEDGSITVIGRTIDGKSARQHSSHVEISYGLLCRKKERPSDRPEDDI